MASPLAKQASAQQIVRNVAEASSITVQALDAQLRTVQDQATAYEARAHQAEAQVLQYYQRVSELETELLQTQANLTATIKDARSQVETVVRNCAAISQEAQEKAAVEVERAERIMEEHRGCAGKMAHLEQELATARALHRRSSQSAHTMLEQLRQVEVVVKAERAKIASIESQLADA